MTKPHIHLAQFLCHGPTYHSLAMWRHPRTAAAGYDSARPELYQHIARVCERGKFDMVLRSRGVVRTVACPTHWSRFQENRRSDVRYADPHRPTRDAE